MCRGFPQGVGLVYSMPSIWPFRGALSQCSPELIPRLSAEPLRNAYLSHLLMLSLALSLKRDIEAVERSSQGSNRG
jgi:hypothetical protein